MVSWIHSKRKALGFSQEQVAQLLGMSRPTYIALEKGERTLDAETKHALSRIFGVDAKHLVVHASVQEKRLTSAIREIPRENVEKFKQVLLYILEKVGSRPNIGQMAIYKLLYFMDFDYYEKYHKQFIGATYIKNTYGPTPVSFARIVRDMEKSGQLVEVKSKYFEYQQTKYIATKSADVSTLTGAELKHIDDTLARLAHRTAKELSDLSHIDTPWAVAKEKEVLNYEHVFYRPEETSVGEYEAL